MGTDAIDMVEVNEQQRRRELADRFASVGMVAAGVAHDLSNPLSAVINSVAAVSVALQRNDLTMAKALLGDAADRAQTMATLIGYLKAALHPREAKPAEIADVIAVAIGLAEPQIRPCARLVCDVPRGLRVVADESRLVQVFLRVLLNAAQSIGEGGAGKIQVRAKRADRSIEVAITDTGRGIPARVLPRIFEPFFSTKPAGQGSGLGLFLSSEIVTALGGSIRAESVEGKGATFYVCLPDADRTEAGGDRVSGVIRAGTGVLLVLDNDADAHAVISVASDRTVEHQTDPEYVLRRIRAGISYDLIFCGAVVNDITAVEFHGRLRELPGDHAARVVFLVDGIAPHYARAQRIALLRKPLAVGEARALIRARLGAEPAAKPA